MLPGRDQLLSCLVNLNLAKAAGILDKERDLKILKLKHLVKALG
jgi:hypothetical protein